MVKFIDEQTFQQLDEKLDKIAELLLVGKSSEHSTEWLSGQQVMKMLNVCSRTLQNYRDEGLLGFSKFGSKILYLQNDVTKFLEKHHHHPFIVKK